MRPTVPASLCADPGYEPLKRFVIDRTGLAYYDHRESDLARKVQLRLDTRTMENCESYLELLRDEIHGREEFDALIAELTIGETHFFRHREMFDAIREIVLPDVVERNRAQRRIRVWSAGCSIGAEAYSLSILFREFLGTAADDWDVSILGTDINREYLARAARGEFDDWALRSMHVDARRRYFERREAQWAILPAYQKNVCFRYHNLVQQRFPSLGQNLLAFDIILCRNVMIYFNQDVNQRLMANLRHSLADEGWLAVGHSEWQGKLFAGFRHALAPGAVLYQKPAPGVQTEPSRLHAKFADPPDDDRTPPPRSPGDCGLCTAASAVAPQLNNLQCNSTQHGGPTLTLANVQASADRGELEAAVRLCAQLMDSDKHSPRTNLQYALLLEQTGRPDEAEQWLRKALYLDRTCVLAHFHLGLLFLRRGRSDAAKRAWNNVLELTSRVPAGRIEGAEEMQVGDLRQLTQSHLSLLNET